MHNCIWTVDVVGDIPAHRVAIWLYDGDEAILCERRAIGVPQRLMSAVFIAIVC